MALSPTYTRLIDYALPTITGSHSDFVMLLKYDDFNTGDALDFIDQGGGDLRFSSDDSGNNQLPCEVVEFDKVGNSIQVWIKIPNASTGQVIYVWGDKTGDSQPAVTDTYGRNAVWSDYHVVSHDAFSDSTGNATVTASGSLESVSGVFGNSGGGRKSNSNSDYVDFTGISASTQWTLQAWVITEFSSARFVGLGQIGSAGNQANLGLNSGDSGVFYQRNGTSPSIPVDYTNGTNYEFFVARESSALGNLIWVNDGTDSATTTYNSSFPTLDRARLFKSADDTPFGTFAYSMSEARISKLALADDYIATEYNNQSAIGAWGVPTRASGGGATITADLATTAKKPTVLASSSATLPQPDSAVVVTTKKPTVSIASSAEVPQPSAVVSITSKKPSVQASSSATLPQPQASASVTAKKATVSVISSASLPQPDIALTTTAKKPSVSVSGSASLSQANAVVSITAKKPTIQADSSATLPQPDAALVTSAKKPTVSITGSAVVPYPVSDIAVIAKKPTVNTSGGATLPQPSATIASIGKKPTVAISATVSGLVLVAPDDAKIKYQPGSNSLTYYPGSNKLAV